MFIEELLKNPYMIFIKDYWIVIVAVLGTIIVALKYIIKALIRINKIDGIDTAVDALKKDSAFIKGRITSIDKMLKNLLPPPNNYGVANSPMILRDELRHFVTDTGVDTEVVAKKTTLVDWLKNQKPATGIDAQEDIYGLVMSGEVEKYLAPEVLNKFKQNLYSKGKTSRDVYGILGVYLFEILIPELNLPERTQT